MRRSRIATIPRVWRQSGRSGSPDGWHQLNLMFAPGPQGYLRLLASDIPDRIARWLEIGRAADAFFMHKSPGIRMRVRDGGDRLGPSLHALLSDAVDAGNIARFTTGIYEPEQRLFGGPCGLALAHAFFTADSAAVWAYYRAAVNGRAAIPTVAFTTALLGRLTSSLFDRFEAWDVWCRVRRSSRYFHHHVFGSRRCRRDWPCAQYEPRRARCGRLARR